MYVVLRFFTAALRNQEYRWYLFRPLPQAVGWTGWGFNGAGFGSLKKPEGFLTVELPLLKHFSTV